MSTYLHQGGVVRRRAAFSECFANGTSYEKIMQSGLAAAGSRTRLQSVATGSRTLGRDRPARGAQDRTSRETPSSRWRPRSLPFFPKAYWRLCLHERAQRKQIEWRQSGTVARVAVGLTVQPAINHSSSSATPRQKTRLVVSSGNESRRLNRICAPKIESVPVPAHRRLWLAR